jgi:hypothetical protein
MTSFSIHIKTRDYTEFEIYNKQGDVVMLDISPSENKLLDQDTFCLDSSNQLTLLFSPIRNQTHLAGVLILENNKTYGKHKSKTHNKYLYKCIPDSLNLPAFYIPYEIKSMGFSKVFHNLYITFAFSSWEQKHPLGILTNTIGPVHDNISFFEYQLYCKNLHCSLQPLSNSVHYILRQMLKNCEIEANNKQLTKIEKNNKYFDYIFDGITTHEKYSMIEDRTQNSSWNIFSIDPKGCIDFDDAFSIKNTENGCIILSIYIANLPLLLDILEDNSDLNSSLESPIWSLIGERVSTIYLPDFKRAMLPLIITDNLASLIANKRSVALAMDITIQQLENKASIIDTRFVPCLIKPIKNYIYEESSLLELPDYKLLWSVTQNMHSFGKQYLEIINNSHDIVAWWMIHMNYDISQRLLSSKSGILRVVTTFSYSNYVPLLDSYQSQYISLEDLNEDNKATDLIHTTLKLDSYTHITSPIRRMVDLLNMIHFQHSNNLFSFSNTALSFLAKWMQKIKYINIQSKLIRQIQNTCDWLELVSTDDTIVSQVFSGYCIEQFFTDATNIYHYNLFIPLLNKIAKISSMNPLTLFTVYYSVKPYIFFNEQKFKKKIQFQLLL